MHSYTHLNICVTSTNNTFSFKHVVNLVAHHHPSNSAVEPDFRLLLGFMSYVNVGDKVDNVRVSVVILYRSMDNLY